MGAATSVDPRVIALCGFRAKTGKPNVSDGSKQQSVLLAERFFEILGVLPGTAEPPDAGSGLAELVRETLQQARPDLVVARERHPKSFAQYEHLAIAERAIDYEATSMPRAFDRALSQIAALSEKYPLMKRDFDRLHGEVAAVGRAVEDYALDVAALIAQSARHSLLGLDVAVSRPSRLSNQESGAVDELLLGVSCKWTLRTDRGQDAVAQGDRLADHR